MPPVISTTSSLTIDGGTSVHITSDSDITTWHTDYGTLSNSALRSVDWLANNETRTAQVWGVGTSGTSNTLVFIVTGLLPNYWAWKTPVTAERDMLIFRPQAGPSQSRTLSGRYMVYQLGNDQLPEDEFYLLLNFHTFHHNGLKQFWLDDPTLQRKVLFESDSKLQFSPITAGFFSFNWQIREAWPYTVS